MRKSRMIKNGLLLVLLLSLAIMSVQCKSKDADGAEVQDISAQIKAGLQESMTSLTAAPRGAGYAGEKDASDKLTAELEGLGYTVSQQAFSVDTEMRQYDSLNTVAVKPASAEESEEGKADILIISSHLDSKPSTVGANDNGSGVAAMMEIAKQMADKETDTELRFIAFGAEEDGLRGSAAYAEAIPDDEKDRIIGAIQLDMLGNRVSEGICLCTVNGEEVLLNKYLDDSAKELTGNLLPRNIKTLSDHTSFMRNGIPAVLVEQDKDSFENHSMLDDLTMIDFDKLTEATMIVLGAVEKIAGDETSGVAKEAYRVTDFSNIIGIMQTREVMDFGLDQFSTENKVGIPGTDSGSHVDESGATITSVSYMMKWFGMDDPITTVFNYREGYLDSIDLQPSKDGLTAIQMKENITRELGEGTVYQTDGVTETAWDSWIYRKYYSLKETGTDFTISVVNSYNGNQISGSYELENGELKGDAQMDEKHQKIWNEIITKVIDDDHRAMIGKLDFFSDGVGFITGITTPISESDNSKMHLMLDINDILDENGEYRHFDKSVSVVVHELGHILTLNSTQATLGKDGDIPVMFDKVDYAKDSYMREFFNTFCDGMDSDRYGMLYVDHPEYFVSAYGSDNVSEDIAESFMVFVMGDKRAGETAGEKKVNFFYDFDELVKVRDFIRGNFGLN